MPADPISIPPKKREGDDLFLGLFNQKSKPIVATIMGLGVGVGGVFAVQSRADAHVIAVVAPLIESHANAEEAKHTAIAVTTDDHGRRLTYLEASRTADEKAIRETLDVLKSQVQVLSIHDDERHRRGR